MACTHYVCDSGQAYHNLQVLRNFFPKLFDPTFSLDYPLI